MSESEDQTPPESESIERDGSAPVQQSDAGEGDVVDFIGLLADEFGIARSIARMDLLMGTVTVDGEATSVYNTGGGTTWPRAQVEGKTVEVKGGHTNRTYRFQVQ